MPSAKSAETLFLYQGTFSRTIKIEELYKFKESKVRSTKLKSLLKITNQNEKDIMNLSLIDTNGSIMIISQFTLMASTKKGNRPSYINAANHKHAVPLYNYFIRKTSNFINTPIVTGEFGANMLVSIENDGPVTIVIDSKNKE